MNEIEAAFGHNGLLATLFPGYEPRPQQIQASEMILDTMKTQGNLIAELPCGVGKSLAALIPAFERALYGETTVISTHSLALQSQLMNKDIPLVKRIYGDKAAKIQVAQIKGRANFLCNVGVENAKGDILLSSDKHFQRLQRWSESTLTGDKSELDFPYSQWEDLSSTSDSCARKKCPLYYECFYYRNRIAAKTARIIVVNHALFLTDLLLRANKVDEKMETLIPDYHHVLFDEAHHLEEVATSVFGKETSSSRVKHLSHRLKRSGFLSDPHLSDLILASNEAIYKPFLEKERFDFTIENDVTRNGRVVDLTEQLSTIADSLKQKARPVLESNPQDKDGLAMEVLANSCTKIAEDTEQILLSRDENKVRWGSLTRGKYERVEAHLTPISVSEDFEVMLWDKLKDKVSITLLSATLSANGRDFRYLRHHLGNLRSRELIVESPFNFEDHSLLYVPDTMPETMSVPDETYIRAMVSEIDRLTKLTQGRAFLLFTSRSTMEKVYAGLREITSFPLFRQGDMGVGPLVEAFRKSGNGILLGLRSFMEGIDVQGSDLSLVILDRIPFAVPDSPVQKAKLEHITKRGGNAFVEYSVPQAIITLKQAMGRLIRTVSDTGITVCLDRRLLDKPYGKRIINSLPPSKKAKNFSVVERWWKEFRDET